MKHLTTTLTILALAAGSLFAQAPQAFKYQTVIRDVLGNIVANQSVSFRLSILEDNASGTVAYSETQTATTNKHGLVELEIGNGTPSSGTFAAIDWASHLHFVKVEFDINAGTSYTMGTSQLMSVPYVLHAGTANQVDDDDADPTNEIQQLSRSGDTIFISKGNFVVVPGLSVNGQ